MDVKEASNCGLVGMRGMREFLREVMPVLRGLEIALSL